MKNLQDKDVGWSLGCFMDDTNWWWVTDKAWTCKLTEGPLVPPPFSLTHSCPSRCHQLAKLGSIARAALREQRLAISLILIPSRVHSKVIQWFSILRDSDFTPSFVLSSLLFFKQILHSFTYLKHTFGIKSFNNATIHEYISAVLNY